MIRVSANRVADGHPPLEFGVGCNYGDVMYGNIGSQKRLDFTVIGPAVIIAARLETLSKALRRRALFSAAFVARPIAVIVCMYVEAFLCAASENR